MTPKRSKPQARKPRTDALRNRQRILDVARAVFAKSGATASLDEIARKAEVGPGTLYRHFPTRDALIEAVFHSEVEKLAAAQRTFSETMNPVDALRAWMLLFIDYVAAKHIIAPVLNSVTGGPTKLYEGSRGLIRQANDTLIRRAIVSGDLRKDLDHFDLMRALIGVCYTPTAPDWQQSARRLVDILIQGARPLRGQA